MGNHTDRLLDSTFVPVLCTELRVGDHCIPLVSGIANGTGPLVGILGAVSNECEVTSLMFFFDLTVDIVDVPDVVHHQDYVWLLDVDDFFNALHTKRFLLEAIGAGVHLDLVLPGCVITPPVVTQTDDIVVMTQMFEDVLSHTSKSGHGDNVTTPKELLPFSHYRQVFALNIAYSPCCSPLANSSSAMYSMLYF